ncbi:hypothetical protein BGZ67_008708 [Mortierella alpina]|nr:hypothetical protein BGZ67_008708 [Mortierella alpina]
MLPRSNHPWHPLSLVRFTLTVSLAAALLLPSISHAGSTSARLQCQYSFLGTANLIRDPACTLEPLPATEAPPPPALPSSPALSAGPLTPAPTAANPWSVTPGWVYNPLFLCSSFSAPAGSNNGTGSTPPPTMITTAALDAYASVVDGGQQELELSVSYYTSDGLAPTLSTSPLVPSTDTFLVLVRFLDANGGYMVVNDSSKKPESEFVSEADAAFVAELNPGEADRLLYYAFDVVTLAPVRVPPGARGVVLQVLVPGTRASFCFDYFALRILQGAYHPATESLLQKVLIGLASIVMVNAVIIPVILFSGLPGWLWRSAPVNFFQKNPVVDHYVPLALFISTCQWIYNILLQYLGGSSSRISIIHSPYALWLIPLVMIGTFFVSAFAHWALFLCYNQVMQLQSRSPRRLFFHSKPRRWRAPLLGLWSASCLIVARVGMVALSVVQGGYWSTAIGILLAVPETVAMISVVVFFLKTMWWLIRTRKDQQARRDRGISSKGIAGGGASATTAAAAAAATGVDGLGKNNAKAKGASGADLSRSSSTTPLWDSRNRRSMSSDSGSAIFDDPQDDLIDLSSFHHRAYVKSLLVPETDLKDAAGSMYGRSTIGSDKTMFQYRKPGSAAAKGGAGTSTSGQNTRYMGSTINTTISMVSSSATEYARYPTEYDFNISDNQIQQQEDGRLLSPASAAYDKKRGPFPFEMSLQLQGGRRQAGAASGTGTGASEKAGSTAPSSSSSAGGPRRPPLHKNRPSSSSRDGLGGLHLRASNNNINNNKLTWNSATTSYTTASAAQPMTGAPPTPSTWEYIVYPQRHVWPTIKGTYLLIARLPLRILVAVLTTLVLCYDVLLSLGAAETELAVPVSCLLGAMAYPGKGQFDNTMNVARAMHTVNLVLIVVLLPAVVMMTILHQIRMVQKYNWCLRLLRIGNYGFVPGGREYTQHLKHPVRFIGYTVGFGVVGLCFTIFVLFALCTLVAMLLVAATFRSSLFRTLGSRALAAFGISCLLVLILWLVQMLVIRYRFRMPGSRFLLAPQQSTRASFHHWEFFWAFFNIVFGAFAFCKRIALSVLSMGIYSTRVDLCIMGGRFRPWDGGYSAFVGLVLADHVMNNPIVLEFVQILRDLLIQRRYPPHLAHLYLEARGRATSSSSSRQGGRGGEDEDEELREQRERRLMLLMRPRRALNDIEEGEEARMDELLMASGSGSGAGVGVGGAGAIAVKGGAIIPEVSKIHHYFRLDPRVDRHGTGQGPLGAANPGSPTSPTSSGAASPPPAYNNFNRNNNNRVSKIYTPLLTTTTATGTMAMEDPLLSPSSPSQQQQQQRHVHLQDPVLHDPETAVPQEQIRQRLTEAKRRSMRVRNRWFLYVTLVRNPELCSLRRSKTKDFLHPIAHGAEYLGSHQEEALTDIQWDRED